MSGSDSIYANYYRASVEMLNKVVRPSPENAMNKVLAMQEAYLVSSTGRYAPQELDRIRKFYYALRHKYFLTVFSLEQSHAIFHTKNWELAFAAIFDQEHEDISFTDIDYLLAQHSLECFLFEARSFLDFFMMYVSLMLCDLPNENIYMGLDKFYDLLDKHPKKEAHGKVNLVRNYFKTKVFSESPGPYAAIEENWGKLLKQLRDKIAHKDIIYPSQKIETKIFDQKILVDWPVLRNAHFNTFCQAIENGIFFLFYDICPIVFEIEWMVGTREPSVCE